MTDTFEVAHHTKGVWGPEVASAVAQILQPLVVQFTAMHVDGKQAHWHVRGQGFVGVHRLLDEYVDHLREWSDLMAERVVALGLPVDGRIGTVARDTTTAELKPGFQTVPDTVAAVVDQIDATPPLLHKAIKDLEEIDPASQDVLIGIEQGLVKDRWFLHAHIAEE